MRHFSIDRGMERRHAVGACKICREAHHEVGHDCVGVRIALHVKDEHRLC